MSERPKTPDCPKCQSLLTPGYMVGVTYYPPQWASKVKSFLGGFPALRQTMTFGCEQCGYLESYLLPPGIAVRSLLPKT